jgi:hypothetical protein
VEPPSSLSRFFRIRTIALTFCVVVIFLATFKPILDQDFWWHLKTGEVISQSRAIPYVDIYSHTMQASEWVTHEWLSEVIIFQVYSHLGEAGIIFMFACLASLAILIACLRSPMSVPMVTAVVALLAAFTASPTLGPKPRVFTFLLSSLFIYILDQYIRGRSNRLILLPFLMILWVNLHGGFFLGPVFISVFIFGSIVENQKQKIRNLVMVLVASMVAILVNPNGVRIYSYPFETLSSGAQQALLSDWVSPDFHDTMFLPLAVLILATIAAFALSQKRPAITDLIMVLIGCFASLRSARHVSIFSIVAIPVLINQINMLLPTSTDQETQKTSAMQVLLNLVFIAFLIFYPVFYIRQVLTFKPTARAEIQPEAAVQFMKNNSALFKGNLFNKLEWGGYLIWNLPERKVFIDGRPDMYGDRFFSEYYRIYTGSVEYEEPFQKYNVQTALIEPDSAIARLIEESGSWRKVYADKVSVIYVRN